MSDFRQQVNGDKNTQIHSGRDTIAAIGDGAMSAGGSITINQGIDPVEYAKLLSIIERYEEKNAQLERETDEAHKRLAAFEASRIAEELQDDGNVEFDGWKLIEVGNAARIAGRLEVAYGYYQQALRKFKLETNRAGEAGSLNNLGVIAKLRGDLDEAERFYRECMAIERAAGNRLAEAGSLNNLGEIARARGDLDQAEGLHMESLAIKREVGDEIGEAGSLNNLGEIARARGDHDEAERLYRESMAIESAYGNRSGEAGSLNNLGLIAKERGDLDEAERLLLKSLAMTGWSSSVKM